MGKRALTRSGRGCNGLPCSVSKWQIKHRQHPVPSTLQLEHICGTSCPLPARSTRRPPTFSVGLFHANWIDTCFSFSFLFSFFQTNNDLSLHSLDAENQSGHFFHATAPGSYTMELNWAFYPYIWQKCFGPADGIYQY